MTTAALALLITARVSCMPCADDGSGGCKWSWFIPGRATPVTASHTFRAPNRSSCFMASAHVEQFNLREAIEIPGAPSLEGVEFLRAQRSSRAGGWCSCRRRAPNDVICESGSTWTFLTPSGAEAFAAQSRRPGGGPNYGTYCFREGPDGALVPEECPPDTEAQVKAQCEAEAGQIAQLFDGAEFR